MTTKYKWDSVQEWFADFINDKRNDPAELFSIVQLLVHELDADQIQDLFQSDMTVSRDTSRLREARWTMTTETKGMYTPGAMRAAQVIDNTYVKVMRDAGLTVRREDDAAAERLAVIIDRETHAGEMLEALKDVDLRCTQAKLAVDIGKQSVKRQVEFLLSEIRRIQVVTEAAIANMPSLIKENISHVPGPITDHR
jgi:hypothetical protein